MFLHGFWIVKKLYRPGRGSQRTLCDEFQQSGTHRKDPAVKTGAGPLGAPDLGGLGGRLTLGLAMETTTGDMDL